MVIGKQVFYFIDKREGTTKDGDKYLSINVLSEDNRKLNFITKDKDLINKISPLNLKKFSEIRLVLKFDREFNNERRTSYWSCSLVGVE